MPDGRPREVRLEQHLEDRTRSAFQRLAPARFVDDAPLDAIERELDSSELTARLDAHERSREYPRPILERLRAHGLAHLLIDPPGGACGPSRATVPHAAALSALCARRSGSLAVTVGVSYLGLLPLHAGASVELLDAVGAKVHEGASAALLLTERAFGSNLLATAVRAERDPATDGYRLHGEKDLVNGATEHPIRVVLARVRERGPEDRPSTADLGLFVVMGEEQITPLPRWRTLPVRCADISGVRFEGTAVPAAQRLGRGGDGFELVQRALVMTRGGVGAFCSGAVSGALDVARAYAGRRAIWGMPIHCHGAIADHLARMEALDWVVAATALKAMAMTNALGEGAAVSTAVAKLACSMLAEEAVTEGRRVLGSRALLEDGVYDRFVRDVLVYAAFDGSTHVMLEQLQWRLSQIVMAEASTRTSHEDPLDAVRAAYGREPRPLLEVASTRERAHLPTLTAHVAALARIDSDVSLGPLETLARGLAAVTGALRSRGRWEDDQGLRFEAAEVFALYESTVALVELADPDRRASLGMPAIARASMDPPAMGQSTGETLGDESSGRLDATYRMALGLVGARVAARLSALALRGGVGPIEGMRAAEQALWSLEESGRTTLSPRGTERGAAAR